MVFLFQLIRQVIRSSNKNNSQIKYTRFSKYVFDEVFMNIYEYKYIFLNIS